MIEREEYCVDILQQTSALRAAVDSLAILVLEDHVQGCVRTAAEHGDAERYVDEVVDVVRRTLGRPVRRHAQLTRPTTRADSTARRVDPRVGSYPPKPAGRVTRVDNPVDDAVDALATSGIRTGRHRGASLARGRGNPTTKPNEWRQTEARRA